jgi:hypothetical protein
MALFTINRKEREERNAALGRNQISSKNEMKKSV